MMQSVREVSRQGVPAEVWYYTYDKAGNKVAVYR